MLSSFNSKKTTFLIGYASIPITAIDAGDSALQSTPRPRLSLPSKSSVRNSDVATHRHGAGKW
jgi:hypothetical protein